LTVLKYLKKAFTNAPTKPEGEAENPKTSGFAPLGLIEPLLKAVAAEGYTDPTPIQRQSIPHILAGRDILGCAQTGTGKTAAFALPTIQLLELNKSAHRKFRALILAPTRELAIQIGESFGNYGAHAKIKYAVIFGGVGQTPQVEALRRGPEVVIATPGRLLDLMGQGYADFGHIEIFVLDEADRMLDMGFIHDVRKVIAALPKKRQNLLFSATMPREIQELADKMLHDPAKVEVAPVSSTADTIDQSLYFVDKKAKTALLKHLLTERKDMSKCLVFTRTKHGANRVAESLTKAGIGAEAIHGNKSQSARQRALSNFKNGTIRVLVASDIAARGLDVEEISHVVNFDLPNVPETYVHRIGRTGRAMAIGAAISFCDREERPFLRDIERLIRKPVPVVDKHPYPPGSAAPEESHERPERGPRPQGRGRPQNRPSQGQGRAPQQRPSQPRPASDAAASGPGDGKKKRRRRRRPGGGAGGGQGGGPSRS
jgi:ATP-dependent RNA helicase RhlE